MSDPRVRVEQRLREAGLQNTDYARHVMTQLHPANPPRRDAESNVFKWLSLLQDIVWSVWIPKHHKTPPQNTAGSSQNTDTR